MKDVLVYISGPISPYGDVSMYKNIEEGIRFLQTLAALHIPAFSPHMIAHHVKDILNYEEIMEYDLIVLTYCSHILMMPTWQISRGAQREHEFAKRLRIPILYTVSDLIQSLEPLKYE